jgi:hypothetical protein
LVSVDGKASNRWDSAIPTGDLFRFRRLAADLTPLTDRRFLFHADDGTELAREVTWTDLAAVNEPHVLDAPATLVVDEVDGFGMCDIVKRVA